LALRDGWAYVLEDGHPVLSLKIGAEKLADVPKFVDSKPGRLSIVASNCSLELARIRIARDVYYTQVTKNLPGPSWERFSATLGANEYFVLGDNSDASADSRSMGPANSDDIQGIARWCYWPPSRMHTFQ
jgi:hypothetical protein